ncbi:hypothetical protein [Streptomyces cadmiisoli]|uniref:hypothetical protein n=1 Tax=Streptomyces cadmiisoli TaxID=2184053 RepID=UPI0013A6E716|nr:hypothetical protein [Streptomyces cadmiisoli]
MIDRNEEQESEAAHLAGAHLTVEDADQELTEQDLDLIDGGDGGQTPYPPYL